MLKKGAMFTDIHFGRKNNSEIHNQDCINSVEWFCDNVRKDQTIDHIWFLGDWHEHRSAINAFTLQKSYHAAQMLNELGLPLYFLVGNHDCAYRNSRDTFTTEIFSAFENFTLIDSTRVIEEIHGTVLAIPYLNEDEYPSLLQHAGVPVAMGHLELQGFRLSGSSNILEHGPEAREFFKKQTRVFSGHFHQRQTKDNIHYIGNIFPMDFSDANDNERGMAVYDFVKDELTFIDWKDCPKYIKTNLSTLLKSHKTMLDENTRVRVLVDTDVSLTETNDLKKVFSEKYSLREIVLEEQLDVSIELTDIEQAVEDMKLESVEEIIPELLKRVQSDKIVSETLVKIFKEL